MGLLIALARSRPRSTRGLTLIELIFVLVVAGIIFALGALVLGRSFESYDLSRTASDADWQGRVALERIVRELRQIRSNAATDLAFSATEVRFIDINGNPACFHLVGNGVQRSNDGPAGACGATAPEPLADNVVANGLNLFYYDRLGNPAVASTDVYYIALTLQVHEGSVDETYRATVQPRRF